MIVSSRGGLFDTRSLLRPALLLGCASAPLISSSAAAQVAAADAATTPVDARVPAQAEGLEEIVVTAQRRAENLQKVPVSVTAVGSAQLQAQGINSVVAIQQTAPGVQIAAGSGVLMPFIRGIGSTANALGNESSVAVYADGVYYTRLPIAFFSLANIERVEVLKGPQGTLFGRNSSGGVIQIVTPDPAQDFSGKASVGYGNFDTFMGSLYATGGLAENVAIDLSVSGQKTDDGYGRNIITGNRANPMDFFSARSKLKFTPGETTKILLTGFYSYSLVGALGNAFPGTTQGYQQPPLTSTPFRTLPGFWDQRSDKDNRSKAQSKGISARIDQEFNFATLSSITAYNYTKDIILTDSDYLDRNEFLARLPGVTKQFTQEFQLASASSSAVKWLAGLFYYNTLSRYDDIRFTGTNFFPAPLTDIGSVDIYAKQRAKSYAAYGQASYEIVPALTLTGGLRYTIDKLRGNGRLDAMVGGTVVSTTSFPPGKDEVKKLTYRAAVDYQLAEEALLYASISRGYKSAGFNLIPFTATPTRPEILDAYEAGLKTDLLDRRLRLNISAFWYDVKNPQVQSLNNGTLTLSNAGSSRVKGVDFEGQARLAPGLTARFGASYLSSKYRQYLNAPAGSALIVPPYGTINPLQTINAAGKRTPNAPELTGTLALNYNFDTSIGKWQLTADYYYNDGYYFEPDNLLRQGSYSLLGAQIAYSPNDVFTARVFGRNLSNKEVVSFASAQAGPAGYPMAPGVPRTYGVSVDYKF